VVCTGVVLAAGASTRFGGLKLAAKYRGKPLVRWAVESAKEALGEVYVVLGYAADEVRRAAGPADGFIHNPWWRLGLSTSVKAAVSALIDRRCLVFMLGDMPEVSPRTVVAVASACERGIVFPVYKGARGNPAACCRDAYPLALELLSGDVGLRALVEHVEVKYVEVDDPGVLFDVDTPSGGRIYQRR